MYRTEMILLALAWAWILWKIRYRVAAWFAATFMVKASCSVPAAFIHSYVDHNEEHDELTSSMQTWLHAHCRGAWRFRGSPARGYRIDFSNAEDSVLYALTWL